jgi:hypothetical protein
MSNLYKVNCSCGYRTSTRLGGNRRDFDQNSTFPFYCKKCGLVDINIMKKPICCSSCNSVDIIPYGEPETSLPNEWKMVQCFDYRAPKEGNFCPKCEKFTMNFELEAIFG